MVTASLSISSSKAYDVVCFLNGLLFLLTLPLDYCYCSAIFYSFGFCMKKFFCESSRVFTASVWSIVFILIDCLVSNKFYLLSFMWLFLLILGCLWWIYLDWIDLARCLIWSDCYCVCLIKLKFNEPRSSWIYWSNGFGNLSHKSLSSHS